MTIGPVGMNGPKGGRPGTEGGAGRGRNERAGAGADLDCRRRFRSASSMLSSNLSILRLRLVVGRDLAASHDDNVYADGQVARRDRPHTSGIRRCGCSTNRTRPWSDRPASCRAAATQGPDHAMLKFDSDGNSSRAGAARAGAGRIQICRTRWCSTATALLYIADRNNAASMRVRRRRHSTASPSIPARPAGCSWAPTSTSGWRMATPARS